MKAKRLWEIGAGVALLLTLAAVLGGWYYHQSLNEARTNALTNAVTAQDGERAAALLRRGAKLDRKRVHSADLLVWAAGAGERSLVDALLETGISPNLIARDRQTPLLAAVQQKQLKIVETLLEHGADPDARDGVGRTPLVEAAQVEDLSMIKTLLVHGVKIDAPDGTGWNALMYSVSLRDSRYKLERVRILLQHGANANWQDSLGKTPLMCAAENGSVGVVKELLEHSAGVDRKDAKGKSALAYAATQGREEVARLLRLHGAR
jgi:ankyrin repeat protein